MKEKYLIGEVCKLFNITRDTLVHYDKIGLLSPKKDKSNGYRYYDIEDLNCLTDILAFKKLNLPLTDINKAIKDSSPTDILEILREKELHIQEEMNKIKKLQSILEYMKCNVAACIEQLDQVEIREEQEDTLFIEITKENKFNDFIELIEGMVDIIEDGELPSKSYLEYINFSFLIEEGDLFDPEADKRIKWGVTLRKGYKFTKDIMSYKKIECIAKRKYIYTVIGLDDVDYEHWLQYIRNIVEKNNIKVAGPILGRMLLTEYKQDQAIDYYEVSIPI